MEQGLISDPGKAKEEAAKEEPTRSATLGLVACLLLPIDSQTRLCWKQPQRQGMC